MPALAEPVHKGTLVCVVLKARNLPNKKSIGKQDPYTVLSMGQEQQKTKPDKRGGQHPTWDEQLHFEIYEDMEDALAKNSTNSTGSESKATSSPALPKPKGGKKVLKVACYADDSKEPDFIGEGLVDLTETLKTGEFDEWVTIKAKDRYAGEVYLELTFYSSAAPPKQLKASIKPLLSGSDTYGGAGTFQRIEDAGDSNASNTGSRGPAAPPIPASMRPGAAAAGSNNTHNRMSSSISTSSLSSSLHRPTGSMSHSQTMHDLGAGTLRPSSSLANLDAYTPAYAPASISRSTSPVPPPHSSSVYHSAAPSHSSSLGPAAAGSSRRNSYAAPMTSEFGHSITPASYYSQHSITPSQSSHYLQNNHAPESSDDRYATIRPGSAIPPPQPQQQQQQQHHTYVIPRSHSVSHIPVAYTQMPQPDFGPDQLVHSMSQMGFGHSTSSSSVTMDKPLPPPTPSHVDERPPQSHIYQAPAHLASLYTPPPAPAHEMQRPVSPAARPASSPAPTPSVVNAQSYYHHQQPQPLPSIPPRSSSPGAPSSGYTPIPSPYSQPPPLPPQQQHVPRPLPSTQSSTSPASAPYPSHLYQPLQQPSPPPTQLSHSHSLRQNYSQASWSAPPPPQQQPAYAGSTNGHGTMSCSMSSGYVYSPPPQQQQPQQQGSDWVPGTSPSPLPPIPQQQMPGLHSFYGSSPSAYPQPQQYQYSQQPQQQCTSPPQSANAGGYGGQYSQSPPQPLQQGGYAGGITPSYSSSSALYQSHQNQYPQHHQQQQQQHHHQ
ncbi:related to calcineurin temperature suppressor cts1 [Ustilago bromivora]|uniref:Related to calcineurin temperature suppressor cts1 n=1 Tax=Ustilago bromivora TaxID=307758 RepID=A0A1K0HMM3_9BASI|nr:related to calcineurin temperature suppressor cts1 [Ustilago bromivora]SYW77475.1 related to calcineurin temperature suppressor cts1 [Ustilago bromivora]